ncbi:hypothetical protein DI487_01160 [Flavobacterium sediminis]|uniref:Uncharacterized protein n=2 Tax=Flavobacterium TaxID=237 RepID=A0A2U8QR68_9FLAO|nr:hypothetical protein [Flavobacterium sediminis]AWM12613.1 hypothetical protein DI487_01160 [Flavobacterium sediminis]
MKKIFFILLFLIGLYSGFSQSKTNKCKFNFSFEVLNSKENMSPKDEYVSLNWDFSKLNLKKDLVEIEIVPILDCFNGLDATDLRDVVTIKSTDKDFKSTEERKIRHLELMSKCFKYRLIVRNNNCSETSEWKYFSFF